MDYLESLLGLGAGVALAGWVWGGPGSQSSPPGFMDLLPWGVGVVFEGRVVIVNKDGTLSSCFLVEGPDFSTSTAETLERFRWWSIRCWSVLPANTSSTSMPFGGGLRATPGGSLSRTADRISRSAPARDYESEAGEHFITETVLTVTQVPSREIYTRVLCGLSGDSRPSARTGRSPSWLSVSG